MNIQIPQTFQANMGVLSEKDYKTLIHLHILIIGVGGIFSADDAYQKANDKARFRPLLKSPPTDFTEA